MTSDTETIGVALFLMVESIPFARGIQRLTQWRPNSQWNVRPAGLHHWRSVDAVNEVLAISDTETSGSLFS